MDEVRAMGTERSNRVADGNDEVMAHAFKQVFKVEKSRSRMRMVGLKSPVTAFQTIAKLKETDNKETSDVRIYCDDDDASSPGNHWQLKPGKKNRKTEFKDQTWWDEQNHIYRAKGSKGCHQEGTLAQTYKTKDDSKYDICDAGLNFDEGEYPLLGDFKEDDAEIVLLSVEDFDALLSLTVFHEFCHITRVINAPGDRKDPNETSIISADAFAWLGVLAIMEKRNLRLARKDSNDDEEKKRANMPHGGGLVWVDKDKAPKQDNTKQLNSDLLFAAAPNDMEDSNPAHVQKGSVEGDEKQTETQRKEENENTEDKSKDSSSDEEENYELDSSGCPDLSKSHFPCEDCGGRDEHWKCKGDPEDDNRWAGCQCREPDWAANPNPPGLVRPHYREHQEAVRNRHLLREEEDISRAPASTGLVRAQLPSVAMSALPYFTAKW
ncbi:hypothetical protein BDV96DRAFT_684596 [Lophiotrema nucula]|uniref:Uncharacterized protein n=1 Tax=Lophiotrema nucula TaxID=690887 RepID=A0A6A5ZJG2_9PLEO|nr:hypothetical protein BDV96DRAFT_684596 [Lophiotrema nucula]